MAGRSPDQHRHRLPPQLEAWAHWCTQSDVHPLAAERHHVDLWARHLTTIFEALNAKNRDYGHDDGHRVLKVTREGGKPAKVALASPVVRAFDVYLEGRTTGWIFVARDGASAYGYRPAYDQLRRLCRTANLPAGATPHSLRHSYATESLCLEAALQDVQVALGHPDPRTTRRHNRRHNRSRHNLDRSPNHLLAATITPRDGKQQPSSQAARQGLSVDATPSVEVVGHASASGFCAGSEVPGLGRGGSRS